jgi:hypothetical protein
MKQATDELSTSIRLDFNGGANRHHRWYESDVELSLLVESIRQSDESTRHLMADLIIDAVQAYRAHLARSTPGPKSLGAEAHLGLLKAMGKKRWYDKDRRLYKAFMGLYTLPLTLQVRLAIQLNGLFLLLGHYETCSAQWFDGPSPVLRHELARLYLKHSSQAAYHQLNQWNTERRGFRVGVAPLANAHF